MPDLSTVHINQPLSNLSLMYSNTDFAAETVFPVLPVQKRSDLYFIYGRETALSTSGLDVNNKAKSIARPLQEAQALDWSLSTDTYYAEKYHMRHLISDDERQLTDAPLEPETDAVIALKNRLMLDQEVMVAQQVGNSANYSSGYAVTLTTGSTGTSWAQYASPNSLPMQNLLTAAVQTIRGIQRRANSLGINHQAARILSEHPTYTNEFKYVSQANLTANGLAPVIKGLAVTEWLTQQLSGDVWLDTTNALPYALAYYRDPGVGPRTVHFGRTFDPGDPRSGTKGVSVKVYRDEPLSGDFVESQMFRDYKFVSKDSSGLALGGQAFFSVTV